MESTSTTTLTADATAAAGTAPRPLTPGEVAFNYLVFGLSTIASLAFAYYLVTDPTRLTAMWLWIRALPLVVQLLLWLLCLPWMIALWVWNSPWALAIRIVVVAGTLLFAEYLVFPWKP
jgi:hypothetical protein